MLRIHEMDSALVHSGTSVLITWGRGLPSSPGIHSCSPEHSTTDAMDQLLLVHLSSSQLFAPKLAKSEEKTPSPGFHSRRELAASMHCSSRGCGNVNVTNVIPPTTGSIVRKKRPIARTNLFRLGTCTVGQPPHPICGQKCRHRRISIRLGGSKAPRHVQAPLTSACIIAPLQPPFRERYVPASKRSAQPALPDE